MEEYSNAIPADKMPVAPLALKDFKIDLDGDQYFGLNNNGLQTLGGTNVLKSNGLYKLYPDGNGYEAEVLMKTTVTGADVNVKPDNSPLIGQDPFYYALYFAKIAGPGTPATYVNYYLHILDLMSNYLSGAVTTITAQDLPPRPPGLKDYGMNLTLTPMTQVEYGITAYGNMAASTEKEKTFSPEGLEQAYQPQLLSTQGMLIKSKIANNMSKENVRLTYDGKMLNNQTAVYYAAYFQHVDYQPDLVNFFLYYLDQDNQGGSGSVLEAGEKDFIKGGFLPIGFRLKPDANQGSAFLNGINTSLAGQYSVGNYQTNNTVEKLDATQISDIKKAINIGYIYTDANYVNFEYPPYETINIDTWKYYPSRIITTNRVGNQIVRLPRDLFDYNQLITWDEATSNKIAGPSNELSAFESIGATYFNYSGEQNVTLLKLSDGSGPESPHYYFYRLPYNTNPETPEYGRDYQMNPDNPDDPANNPQTVGS